MLLNYGHALSSHRALYNHAFRHQLITSGLCGILIVYNYICRPLVRAIEQNVNRALAHRLSRTVYGKIVIGIKPDTRSTFCIMTRHKALVKKDILN